MFKVGDLVTMSAEMFLRQAGYNVYEKWIVNPFGIVLQIESYKEGSQVLAKVHFQSLGNAYWLYAYELELVENESIRKSEDK